MGEARGNNVRRLLLGCAVTLAGCGGGGGGDSAPPGPPAPARVVKQTDLQIAALLYSDAERTPPGFYADTAPPVATYVATFHLKNTDVAAASQQHELCTDDWNDALSWSEAVASSAATYSDLVATESNTRFFEFGRVPRGEDGAYLRARVYRCSYLDRASVDLLAPGAEAGQLNRRPLTGADLRELSEYLWLFTTYNNFGNAVLRSSGSSTSDQLEHTLHLGRLRRASSGACDSIDVLAWTHTSELPEGTLALTQTTLWTFGASESGSVVELCTP